jgi:hypothetical protein
MPESTPTSVWVTIHRVATVVMPALLTLSMYFITTIFGQMKEMDNRVRAIEIAHASSAANRFTNTDWTHQKSSLDDRHNLIDQRVTRQEQNALAIKDILSRIESKLDRLEDRRP